VCLKLTPDPLKAEVVCSPNFGVLGEDYFHPLAVFKKAGKVAQFAYFDYNYKPFKKDGKWVHRITPA
jgi:putative intracellular protease/amidase